MDTTTMDTSCASSSHEARVGVAAGVAVVEAQAEEAPVALAVAMTGADTEAATVIAGEVGVEAVRTGVAVETDLERSVPSTVSW